MEQHDCTIPQFDLHINTEVIYDFFGDDLQQYEAVLKDFLLEAPRFGQTLESLWYEGNRQALRETVHRFKPLYHYVGLVQAYAQLQELEQGLVELDGATEQLFFQLAQAHLNNALQLIGAEHSRLRTMNATGTLDVPLNEMGIPVTINAGGFRERT